LEALEQVASAAPAAPHLAARALRVVTIVTGPGCYVGSALVLLVYGFFSTNDMSMDLLEFRVGVAVNVVSFAALWFMIRTGARESTRWKLAVALITVWVAVSVPFGMFVSLWMTF
jgi:hypothetical protein